MTEVIRSSLFFASSAILWTISLISRTLSSITLMVAFTFDTASVDAVTILFTCSELPASLYSHSLIFLMISRRFSRNTFRLPAIFPTSSEDLTVIFWVRSPSFWASSLILPAIALTLLDSTPLMTSESTTAIASPASSMNINFLIRALCWSRISVTEQSTPTMPTISPALLYTGANAL